MERFRTDSERYSCVLLDLSVPHMDGIETFRALRRLRPELPVILMSGYPQAELRRRAADLRWAGILAKPFRGGELLEALQRALAEDD